MPTLAFRPPPALAAVVAALAGQALTVELMLTPKPGLVDQRNAGAHSDMDLALFRRSAGVVAPWMPRFAELGAGLGGRVPDHVVLDSARAEGLRCEAAMFQATGSVNTHKGAIFSLGLLCMAAGLLDAEGVAVTGVALCARVEELTAGIVNRELGQGSATAGERAFRAHRMTGARGEAAGGFPTVRAAALPAFQRLCAAEVDERTALLQALLHLMAVNDDTNLVARGGLAALAHVRGRAAGLLRKGGALAPGGLGRLEAFDDDLIARHLSPGGSADLLAVTWLLARVDQARSAPASQERRADLG